MMRSTLLATLILRATLSRDRAAAVLGDLHEELAQRRERNQAPAWPRLWLVGSAFAAAIAAMRSAAPRLMRTWRQTTRDAWRGLRSAPATTALALAILTLGISAATVTFSVVYHVVLRPLPFDRAQDLVAIAGRSPLGGMSVPAVDFMVWRDRADALESVAAVQLSSAKLEFESDADEVLAALVTASLFDVLRVFPVTGTRFDRSSEETGRDAVAVIGYGLWRRRFGQRPDVIGQSVSVGGKPVVIVGVMPPGFTYPVGAAKSPEMWMPYVVPENERDFSRGRTASLQVIGRLRSGSSLDQAQAQLDGITAAFAAATPRYYRDWRAEAVSLYDSLVGNVRGWMLLVLWAVTLVVVVACVNVANLLLTRVAARSREAAIRTSLGASRRQLMAAQLVESLMLAGTAAVFGVVIAMATLDVVTAALPRAVARAGDIAVDWRVMIAAIAAAIGTAALVGVVPAWLASRTDVNGLLKAVPAYGATGRSRWRSSLLVVEVAAIGVLLVTSTLFVLSFIRVTTADLGFTRSNLVVAPLYGAKGRLADVFARVSALPGVEKVAAMAGGSAPLIGAAFGGGNALSSIRPAEAPEGTGEISAEFRTVTTGYFEAARIPIRGRMFTVEDASTRAPVVILDETLARKLFGDRDPIGASVHVAQFEAPAVVVGVASNVRVDGPEHERQMQMYIPLVSAAAGGKSLVVRTSSPPQTLVPAIRKALTEFLPGTTPEVYFADDAFRRITADRRFNGFVMLAFGTLALLIGAAGVYGVMASVVSQQTREIGVRVALGATRERIIAWVLRAASRYVVVGLAIGLLAAAASSRIFAGVLFGVRPLEPVVYLIVALVLTAVGLVAAVLPARRASRVDPVVVLREG